MCSVETVDKKREVLVGIALLLYGWLIVRQRPAFS
jgi:hypothetical protein